MPSASPPASTIRPEATPAPTNSSLSPSRSPTSEESSTPTSATSLAIWFMDPFKEAIEIGERSGVPVHITHFYQKAPSPRRRPPAARTRRGRRRNPARNVTFDSYPYSLGSTRILIVFPDWVHEGGPARLKEALAERTPAPVCETRSFPALHVARYGWLTYFKRPENQAYEGRSIAEDRRDAKAASR